MEQKERRAMTIDDAKPAANLVAEKHGADVFIYNGNVTRANVLKVMDEVQRCQSRKRLFLVMVTYGGDPHAAFKISRYIQEKFDHFSLFVPGFCKSAGTLYAIAANDIIFAPYGELGPLDVQMAKPDQFQFDSGLVIGESLDTLERRVAATFKQMFEEVIAEQQGLISVNSALHAASEIVRAIYNPIMSRIDPEEIGVRQRALRIALDYGERLAIKSQNADKASVRLLAEKYSSHAFVIDRQEAQSLFRSVRNADEIEMGLAYALGPMARIEQSGNQPPLFTVLSDRAKDTKSGKLVQKGPSDEEVERARDSSADGHDSGRTDGASVPAAKESNGRRSRGVRPRNPKNGRGSAEKAP